MSLHHHQLLLYHLSLLACLLKFIPASSGAQPIPTLAPPALSLTAHPANTDLSIGSRFTLQCNVWNMDVGKHSTVWIKDKKHFATDGAFITGQRIIDSDRGSITRTNVNNVGQELVIDTMTINDIQLSDRGNYTCQLWSFKSGTAQVDVILSDSVIVKVLSPTAAPSRNMECSADKTLVPMGDVIALSCQVDMNDHTTVLYWTLEGTDRIYEGVTITEPTSNIAKMVLHFVMSAEFDDKSFVCHVNQTDGAQANYETCSVGPFVILGPTAEIPTTSKTMTTGNKNGTGGRNSNKKDLEMFKGYVFIIIVIAGMFIVCCLTCAFCYFCCCKKDQQGRYEISSRIRRSVKRKPLVPTPSAAAETSDPPHPRPLTGFDESPYYSSVGPGSSGVTSGDRSAADGASYTALQKVDTIIVNDGATSRTSGADIVDEEGYNLVGIGNMGKITHTVTLPSEAKLAKSSPSLKRGFSLGSLSRSRQGSRTSSRASTPVNEEPYYKSIMKASEQKNLETPYYLSVFPPGVSDLEMKDDKSKTKTQVTDIGKSSTVPKNVGGHKKIERQGVTRATTPSSADAMTSEDDYLCPTPTLTGSKSDPKFSNAMYNVF